MARLNVEVVVGLVNRLSAPLRRLQQDVGQITAKMAMAGAGATAFGAGILLPMREAVRVSTELTSALTEVGIVADASAARMAAIRPELRRIAETTNQFVPSLSQGLKDLTAKGMALDAAMSALPAIAKTTTAAGAEMADMSAAASALIGNLGIVPAELQRTLDILTVAGNQGAFELKDMAREFPTLTAALKGLEMQGEGAVASLGAALQVAMKGAGTAPEAANNLLNLLSKMTAPETVDKMKKQWGVDLPNAFRRWQSQGLNPIEESLRLIQERTGGDAFKIGEIFGDMQVMSALKPLLANIEEYRRIRDQALAGAGAAEAQFRRRMGEDPAQAWKSIAIQVGNLTDRLGQALTPVLLRVVAAVRPLIERLAAWIDANPKLASTIALGAGALGVLSVTVGGLLLLLGPLLIGLVALVAPFRLILTLVKWLISPLGWVFRLARGAGAGLSMMAATAGPLTKLANTAGPLLGLAKAFRILNLATRKSPLVLLGLAMAGVALGSQDWDKITAPTGPLGSIMEKISKMVKGLMDSLSLPEIPDASTRPTMVTPPTYARTIIPPEWTPDLLPSGASGSRRVAPAAAPRRGLLDWLRDTWGHLTAWVSGALAAPLAAVKRLAAPIAAATAMATSPASAAVGTPRAVPGGISMPISITIQAPPGADPQRIADLVRREVQSATSQAGRRIAALYDGSDGL